MIVHRNRANERWRTTWERGRPCLPFVALTVFAVMAFGGPPAHAQFCQLTPTDAQCDQPQLFDDCQGDPTTECRYSRLLWEPGVGMLVDACSCYQPGPGCGPIQFVQPSLARCFGECPNNQCVVWFDANDGSGPQNSGQPDFDASGLPPGSTLYCDCAGDIPPPDPHITVQGTSVTFGAPDVPPLPADFFYPGSPPLNNTTVNLVGGSGQTLGQRDGPVVCPLPPPSACNPVQVELVELSLVSAQPVDVGGVLYDLDVTLSPSAPQVIGGMNPQLTHPNGGNYDGTIPFQPRFFFTEVGNAANTAVFDYGIEGQPAIFLNFFNVPWVINLGAHLVGTIDAPNNGNFVPGVLETNPGDPGSQIVVQPTGTSDGGGVTHPVQTPPLCPIGFDPSCAQFQTRDCIGTSTTECLPQSAIVNADGTVGVDACACSDPGGGCGPLDLVSQPGVAVCSGPCPNPAEPCVVWFDDGTGPQSTHSAAAPITFPPGSRIYCDCDQLPDPDPHTTLPGTGVTFSANPTSDVPVLPADFFGPGSLPFEGTVLLEGGDADTLLQRKAELGDMALGETRTVDIELIALSLRSVEPMTVDFGGGTTEDWNVEVSVSNIGSSGLDGFLDARKTHPNGGTYDAEILVLPRLTFVRADGTGQPAHLDYGEDGRPPIRVNFIDIPWVHVLNNQLQNQIDAPNDGEFVPGVNDDGSGNQVVVPANGLSKGGGVTHDVVPPPLCPIGFDDSCLQFQKRDCKGATADTCLPRTAVIDPTGGASVTECACYTSGPGCGPIDVVTQPGIAICSGQCPIPGEDCVVWIDRNDGLGPQSTGATTYPTAGEPIDSILYCDCDSSCTEPCMSDTDCDDGDQCTTDVCDQTVGCCVHTPLCQTNADCDDGNGCTTDVCGADGCCTNTPDCTTAADCPDDGNPCTTETCDPASGCCIARPDCTADIFCDDGDICTIDTCNLNTRCCEHAPDPACGDCEPNADQSACEQVICPSNGRGSPADPCEVVDNGTGTVTLPPIGCDYLSPDEYHEIVDGLPAGTIIEMGAIHKDFICNRQDGTAGCPPPGLCEDAGGALGGNRDCFESVLELQLRGSGPPVDGLDHTMVVPLICKAETAPRNPGDDVQTFATQMSSCQGAALPDSFFDIFTVVAGDDNGLPSPGQTTLTRLPSGNFNVDSFFDIEYRIDWQGAAGGPLAGMSGSHNATIRMQTGTPVTDECQPRCVEHDVVTGETRVIDCDCRALDDCHVNINGPAGDPCDGARGASRGPNGCTAVNVGGTVQLPPDGCSYLSPEDVHEIIDGLPAGVTIEVGLEHTKFINSTRNPGGSLGGEVEQFDSIVILEMCGHDPNGGPLDTFNRTIFVPIQSEVHTGPRTPGDAVQTFPNTMWEIQGDIFGDPDFDFLRIRGGDNLGMPSPGQTTLTRLGPPGSSFTVDSFFDIEYTIEFQGAPGSILSGMAGVTQGNVRMSTGSGPLCEGTCPPGTTCVEDRQFNEATGILSLCCDCVPDTAQCEPDPTGQVCQGDCDDPANEACQARCVSFDPLTGTSRITACDCVGQDDCHIELATTGGLSRGGGGDPCVVANQGGTIELPPLGCPYLNAQEVHEIITNNPNATFVVSDPIHTPALCESQGATGGFPGCPPPGVCEEPGGNLGGDVDCFDSTLEMTIAGEAGSLLDGYVRTINVPVLCQAHSGPKSPGDAVQTFPTQMHFLQGELFGDPDFCTFRVRGGNGFGLPSPGETTITRLGPPGSSFQVDSFFDIEYQIEFQGCPGSPLDGLSGTTTGRVRMQTGGKPECVGTCPDGTVCDETTTVEADGTLTICCDCVDTQPPDPVGEPCVCADGVTACTQDSDCPSGDCCEGREACVQGVCHRPKDRFLTFAPAISRAGPAFAVAIDLPDGRRGWVSQPEAVDNLGADPAMAAWVVEESEAYFSNAWPGVVHLRGCVIQPNQDYELRSTKDFISFSDPLAIGTGPEPDIGSYGDVVGVFAGVEWTGPNSVVNFNDISAVLKKFQQIPTAPHTTQCDIDAQWTNYIINFADVAQVIRGFQDILYPPPAWQYQTLATCPLTKSEFAACCNGGVCTDGVRPEDCEGAGDTWFDGESCADVTCP